MTSLLLASTSASRRAMLTAAGVPHDAVAPRVDEEPVKQALRAEGRDARALADALAELKATRVSLAHPQALVLGCDSTVALDDGTPIDKAESRETAAAQLRLLSGRRHRLWSAAVLCREGQPVWRHVDVAALHVRPLSEAFVETYLDAEWPTIGGCVGGYRMEGPGVQLFERIEGDHFTILGLPLLPLLAQLRRLGMMAS